MSIWGWKVREGDLITDETGDYAQHGRVVETRRQGLEHIATTEDGTELSWLPHERTAVNRHGAS